MESDGLIPLWQLVWKFLGHLAKVKNQFKNDLTNTLQRNEIAQ